MRYEFRFQASLQENNVVVEFCFLDFLFFQELNLGKYGPPVLSVNNLVDFLPSERLIDIRVCGILG